MNLESRLAQDKTALTDEWFEAVLGTYPPETQKVWKGPSDRFTNPVCSLTKEALGNLVNLVLDWNDAQAISTNLETVIKIRNVQEFSPSQTLSFIFLFKRLVRDRYQKELKGENRLEELIAFESKLDNLVMMSLDIFSKSREQLFQMRVEEVKRAQHQLLKRAKMIVDYPTEEAG